MTALLRSLSTALLIAIAAAALAQPAGSTTTAPAPAQPERKAVVSNVVKSKNAAKWIFSGQEAMATKSVTLGDAVIVSVINDDVFRAKAAAKAVTLFINGQDAMLEPIDSATSNYVFRLARTDEKENKKLWERILEAPFAEPTAEIHISVGVKGETALPVQGDAGKLTFHKSNFRSFSAWFWIAVLILVLVYFFHLVRATDILRNGPRAGGQLQAYSLGRSQMAWWLFIVLVSYVTIWLITGNRDTVTSSTLILIGISGATALGAVAIDATASTRTKTAIDRLNTELTTLEAQRNMPGATPALIAALDARIAAIRQEQANIVTTSPTENWLMDILKDDNGAVALHRLQVVLWTFVLGIVFLVSVAHVLSMPEFSTTLLALMGISGATYLGFKMPATS
jgi:hypothetical protein